MPQNTQAPGRGDSLILPFPGHLTTWWNKLPEKHVTQHKGKVIPPISLSTNEHRGATAGLSLSLPATLTVTQASLTVHASPQEAGESAEKEKRVGARMLHSLQPFSPWLEKVSLPVL